MRPPLVQLQSPFPPFLSIFKNYGAYAGDISLHVQSQNAFNTKRVQIAPASFETEVDTPWLKLNSNSLNRNF